MAASKTPTLRTNKKKLWTTYCGVAPLQQPPIVIGMKHCATQKQQRGLCSAITPSADCSNVDDSLVEFLLADIGEGIAEVEVMQWFVEPGDTVQQFDRVCEVQSDKATVEITSRYDGQVRKLGANVGDMIKVGRPLLYIATTTGTPQQQDPLEVTDEHTTHTNTNLSNKLYTVEEADTILHIPPASSRQNISLSTTSSHVDTTDPKFIASPAVRRLVKENSINLAFIQGTGPQGRLLKSDVMKFVAGDTYPRPVLTQDDVDTTQKNKPLPSAYSANAVSQQLEEEEKSVPLRGYNRLMYQRMTESLSVPHMKYGEEVRMTDLISVRSQLKLLAMQQYSLPNLTYLPFFLKAASLALQNYPILNSSLCTKQPMSLIYHKHHHIGAAMDTPRGLVVAVVRDCQEKSLIEIALDLHRLQKSATEGNLSESDVTNATFSISNIGAIGGTYMSPVVIPPTVAIGAMGRIQRVPYFISSEDTKVEAVDVMNVSWGADHRVVDGATLARFSNAWKGFVEHPATMMLTLR